MTMPETILIDARGLRCPLPVLRLAAAARGLSKGARFELLADDPAAATDVPAFVAERGGTIEARPAANGATRYCVAL